MFPVHVSPKHKLVLVPVTDQLRNFFGQAPITTINGTPTILIPNKPREAYMLRKFGYDCPPPILTSYVWPHPVGQPPFHAQKQTAVLMSTHDRCYVLNAFGTGKTRAALWAWDYLNNEGLAGKVLVIAPLSTLFFTWAKEVFDTLPHRKCQVLYGPKDKRRDRLRDKSADIYIVNHDGVRIIMEDLERRTDIDTLIIDELATYRNQGSKKVKVMRDYAPKMKFVYGLTGAPIPTAPTDAWAQAKIITPHTVTKYFKQFKEKTMLQVAPFKWIPKPNAVATAYASLQPAVRFTLDDVYELPETTFRMQKVELGAQQAKVYKEMAKACYVALKNGEITAANAGAVLNKLLQISCGYVYTKEGKTIELDAGKRMEQLLQIVTSNERKVLVFAAYKHVLAGIAKMLTKEDVDHAIISGDTPAGERGTVFTAFQNTNKYHCIAAHPNTMAHGLTLTAANVIVWFGPITNLEIFLQANARISRVGQHFKQLILCLYSTPVEFKMYSMLEDKKKIQDQLLTLFEEDM